MNPSFLLENLPEGCMQVLKLTALFVLIASVAPCGRAQEQKVTVTGKLLHSMAIGGETTGWVIELAPGTTVANKALNSIQVSSHDTTKLDKFVNQEVKATGTIAEKSGVETGTYLVLTITKIKAVKTPPASAQ
jgi:co-chaperonin GroES (HSP10)